MNCYLVGLTSTEFNDLVVPDISPPEVPVSTINTLPILCLPSPTITILLSSLLLTNLYNYL